MMIIRTPDELVRHLEMYLRNSGSEHAASTLRGKAVARARRRALIDAIEAAKVLRDSCAGEAK